MSMYTPPPPGKINFMDQMVRGVKKVAKINQSNASSGVDSHPMCTSTEEKIIR